MVGEPRDEAREVAPDDADDCSAQRYDKERGQSLHDVRYGYVLLAHLHVRLKHVIEDLEKKQRRKIYWLTMIPGVFFVRHGL